MTKIIIGNSSCSIQDEEDFVFLKKLDDELSFKVQGAEHTKAYKGYYNKGQYVKWDGIQRILTRQLTFPYGLLERVKRFYAKYNKQIELDDRRPIKTPSNKIDIIPKLKEIDREPYQYQLDVLDVINNYDCGILRLPTGSGKSLLTALITAEIGKKTIIYVIGKDLLYQFHSFYSQVFNEKIGIIGDGHCEIANINIASVWTVGQALGLKKSSIIIESSDDEEKAIDSNKYVDILKLMKSASVHQLDEAHMASCSTIQEIYRNIKPEYIYGLSATAHRDDGSDLLIESLFGSIIANISASALIKQGYLVKPTITFISVPKYHEKLNKQYQTIYKNYIIENKVRNDLIIQNAIRLIGEGYKTLVLYSKLNHGKILFEELSKTISCVLLSGKSSAEERQKAKDDIEKGAISCIVASTIFDIGVDIPCLSALVNGSGGKSSVRALQRIGRVIRKYPEKTNAQVIDFIDNAHFLKEHSKIRKAIYEGEEEFCIICP